MFYNYIDVFPRINFINSDGDIQLTDYMTYLCMTYITHMDTVVLCMKIIRGIHNGHKGRIDPTDRNGRNRRHIWIFALVERAVWSDGGQEGICDNT